MTDLDPPRSPTRATPRFDPVRAALLVASILALVFVAGFVVAPSIDSPAGEALLRLAYAPLCHQQADRCLDLGAGPFAVCARCTGLYLGGLLGLLVAALCRRPPRLSGLALALAVAPSVLDFTVRLVGLAGLPSWPRFAIAVPAGVALGLLLAEGLADAIARASRSGTGRRSRSPAGEPE